jgi:hypothetical protein
LARDQGWGLFASASVEASSWSFYQPLKAGHTTCIGDALAGVRTSC